MKKLFYAITVILFTSGCTKYFYYVKYSDQNSFNKAAAITLDQTFTYYIRKVYKADINKSKKSFATNVQITGENKNLIEIEYLAISSKGLIIYLTMIQDKRQKFYADNYLGDEFINAYEFKNFLFGMMAGNVAIFESKENMLTTDEWTLDFNEAKDTVFVKNILETVKGGFEQSIPVEKALAEKVGFVKIATPKLVFHNPDYPKTKNICFSADNKINFYRPGNDLRIHFIFNTQQDQFTIYYKANRSPYRPDKLLDK